MSTVAFAWELGANFGHLSRQLGPAMELRRQGHDVVFVVCNTLTASKLLAPFGFAFLQAPLVPVGLHRERRATLNYSSLLAAYGYTHPGLLTALLQAWVHLWHRIKPDVVVIDHSPTALLSTRALGIATVQLGTGFFVPPNADPLPSLQPPRIVAESALASIDEEVLRAINTSLQTLGYARLPRIAELFRGSPALLTTFAELDHYPPRTDVAYIGPVSAATAYPSVEWTHADKSRIFAYVRAATPGIDALLTALCARRDEVKCVIPDASPSLCTQLARAGVDVYREPIDMTSVLRGCHLAINYGSLGTVAQALLEGVPLLLIPQELEQGIAARRAAQIGTALIANRHTTAAFHSWIDRMLGTASFASSAQQFAARYAQFDNDAASKQVASVITSAAAGKRRPALSA